MNLGLRLNVRRDGEHAGEQNILERKTPTMNSDVPITVAERLLPV